MPEADTSQPQMDAYELPHRQQPRLHPHWLLLIAALASLGMLVLACALSGPGSPLLR